MDSSLAAYYADHNTTFPDVFKRYTSLLLFQISIFFRDLGPQIDQDLGGSSWWVEGFGSTEQLNWYWHQVPSLLFIAAATSVLLKWFVLSRFSFF